MADKRKAPKAEEIGLDLYPHKGNQHCPGGQRRLIKQAMRHFVTMCIVGRSWGKTLGVLFLFVFEAAATKGHYTACYAAPHYKVVVPIYRLMKRILAPLVVRASDSQLTLELKAIGKCTGWTLHFWSLENYDALRMFRLNRAVVDEGADVHEDAVFRVLVPMFIGRAGRLLVIGTPKRKGIGSMWMHRLWAQCIDPLEPEYFGMAGSSYGNPTVPVEEIKKIEEIVRARGGEKAVREEIYAEWLEGEGAFFPNLAKTFIVPVLREEVPGRLWIFEDPDRGVPLDAQNGEAPRYPDHYVFGLDFGRHEDYTVGAIFNNRTRRMAALYRVHLRGAPYHAVLRELHELRERYHSATVFYDDTGGHGSAIAEWMAEHYGDGAVGRTWSTQGKASDLAKAQRLCERAGSPVDVVGPSWALGNVPWLYAEFLAYQIQTRNKAGEALKVAKYGAPPNLHDDGVAACALVADHLTHVYVEAPIPEPAPRKGTDAWWATQIKRGLSPSQAESVLRGR